MKDYHICEGFLFKGSRLCVPVCGTRELLIREVHGEYLGGHFGKEKTLAMLKEHYFWAKMQRDVLELTRRYLVCLHLRRERFPFKRKSKSMPRSDGPLKIVEKMSDEGLTNLKSNSSQQKEDDEQPGHLLGHHLKPILCWSTT